MAQLTIPLPVVPLTMQPFAVALTGAVLGAKKGAITAVIYLLLGAVGVPVFANFGGGFHRIIGPWGGYLLSYPFFALVVGLCADKGKRSWLAIGLLAGSAINLTMGTIQLGLVNQLNMREALFVGMFPFIIPDLIRLAMVFAITPKIRQVIARFN